MNPERQYPLASHMHKISPPLIFFLFLSSSPLISLLVDLSLINNNIQDAKLTQAIKHTRVKLYKRRCLCTAVNCHLLKFFNS